MGKIRFSIFAWCLACVAADPPGIQNPLQNDAGSVNGNPGIQNPLQNDAGSVNGNPGIQNPLQNDAGSVNGNPGFTSHASPIIHVPGGFRNEAGDLDHKIVHSFVANLLQRENPPTVDGFKTYLAMTFSEYNESPEESIPGDSVYVVVYPAGQGIAVHPYGHTGKESVKKLGEASARLGVTAIILVAAEGSAYEIRWFGSSGTEYNICGHGNAGAGAALYQGGVKENIEVIRIFPERRPLPLVVKPIPPKEIRVSQTIGVLRNFQSKPVTDHPDTIKSVQAMLGDPTAEVRVYEAEIGVVIEVDEAVLMNIDKDVLAEKSDKYVIAHKATYKARTKGYKPNDKSVTEGKQVDGWIIFCWKDEITETVIDGEALKQASAHSILYRAFYPQLGVVEDMVTGSAFALITATCHEHGSTLTYHDPETALRFRGSQHSLEDFKAAGVVRSLVVDPGNADIGGRNISIRGNVQAAEDESDFNLARSLRFTQMFVCAKCIIKRKKNFCRTDGGWKCQKTCVAGLFDQKVSTFQECKDKFAFLVSQGQQSALQMDDARSAHQIDPRPGTCVEGTFTFASSKAGESDGDGCGDFVMTDPDNNQYNAQYQNWRRFESNMEGDIPMYVAVAAASAIAVREGLTVRLDPTKLKTGGEAPKPEVIIQQMVDTLRSAASLAQKTDTGPETEEATLTFLDIFLMLLKDPDVVIQPAASTAEQAGASPGAEEAPGAGHGMASMAEQAETGPEAQEDRAASKHVSEARAHSHKYQTMQVFGDGHVRAKKNAEREHSRADRWTMATAGVPEATGADGDGDGGES